jgi:NAD(P)-dependent dehydrogenase (short-subunit alcohol dehydrogenase family)
VIATARDPQRLDELAERYPGQAIAARLDVTDADEARAAVGDGLAAFGHIVQVSSLEGIAPIAAGETAYAATKFAVEGLAEALAKEIAHLGIKVTIVEPGPVRTDFAAGAVARPPDSGDYTDSVGKALEWFEDLSGRQPNDPSRVAAAIIEAVTSADPPLRLALGTEAVQAIREKLSSQRRDLDAWERLSASTAMTA